ncbi:hypothetical protein [Kribbella lupini]|uniref:YobI-like P-loop NTPase domain-containing protein n=1 Tax=Kribbella lupini TaxID=291602 RepID=A0ABP4NB79_9ACTN
MGLISRIKNRGKEQPKLVKAPAPPALVPLTPVFDPDQHQEYVDRLVAALDKPAIRNIALTGRYGAGKSSVLQKLNELHSDRVLMLSLSTLGPAEADESSTNQIEKELVKQLLHSRPPSELPQSRYRRIVPLSVRRAVLGSAAQLGVLGGLLWFLGVFPKLADLPVVDGTVGKIIALVAFGSLAIGALTFVRLAVHNRVVSSVSAAGATISLTDKEASYFDEYLDEIVYYFQTVSTDVVVFEDLDRFNDPQIFEALRELNALLNAALASREKKVLFIYALKDSIFEQLGHDTVEIGDDAASAEAVRANRTKFFDLVVPVVPFITHRTSRDLLAKLLADESLVPVSPELIDLTARHITDMRLLKNIRNEYAVFSDRLITRKQGIDKLRPDQVFAMMVYKNIHLADFEEVQLGRSNLDKLYRASRDLVNHSLAVRRARLRRIADSQALADTLAEKAVDYGAKLEQFVDMFRTSAALSGLQLGSFAVGGQSFEPAVIRTEPFWRAVFENGDAVIVALTAPYQAPQSIRIQVKDLRELLLGETASTKWDARESEVLKSEHADLLLEIVELRRADFADLAWRTSFTISRDEQEQSFNEILKTTLKSEVARDLVREGFIDQNFALYVAQYYGDRVSMPAMTFIVQHVQPNIPDANYQFPDPADIASVLRETKARFLDQDCAYNIALLDYLLERNHYGADVVLGRIARNEGSSASAFFETYLSEGGQARQAVRRLAASWTSLLDRLVKSYLASDRRLELVNEAIGHALRENHFSLTGAVEEYLQRSYSQLRYLVEPAEEVIAISAVREIARAGVVVSDLDVLDPVVVPMVVDADIYALTANNLRVALGEPRTLSLDMIAAVSPGIFEDCIENPSDYLAAVQADKATTATVIEAARFTEVVARLETWEDEFVVSLCRDAAAGCLVSDLTDVPAGLWSALAVTRRFPATLNNVVVYLEEVGGIDHDLAHVLVDAGAVDVSQSGVDPHLKIRLAEQILKASVSIPDPHQRVDLVVSLDLEQWLTPTQVEPEDGHLLGELIDEVVCDDTAELFRRFHMSDWETLRYGIERSKKFADFVAPDLLDEDMVAKLFFAPSIDKAVKQAVLARLNEFVPSAHIAALRAVGMFAAEEGIPLDVGLLTRIASATSDAVLVMQLIDQHASPTPDEVISILVTLGGEYRHLATPSAEFDLLKDTHHAAVLNRLQAAGRLAKLTVRRGKNPVISVKVA